MSFAFLSRSGYYKRLPRLLSVGLVAGLFFWLIDAVIHAYVLQQGGLAEQLFAPRAGNIIIRVLVILLSLAFGFHTNHLLYRRELVEQKLRASEEKYRRLVELSPDAIAIQSREHIVFANSASARFFGAETPQRLLGKSVWDFVPSEERQAVSRRYRQMMETGRPSPLMEQRFVRLDGTEVEAEVAAAPFRYEGQPAILAIFRDISERKRAEEELVKLRKAVETSGEVIFLTDRTGIITYINPEFTRLYGFSAEEVVGRVTPRILKSGVMQRKDYEIFWEMLLNKQVVKGELVNKCKDGRLLTVESSANPILDENGEIVGFLAIQRDISERKRAEEELRQRNKELSALNAIAATVSQSFELRQIIRESLRQVLQLDILGDEAYGMLFLLDEKTHSMALAASQGVPQGHPCLASPPQVGECLCGRAVESGRVIVAREGWQDARHTRRWEGRAEHTDVCLPLSARGNTLGVLAISLPAQSRIASGDIELLQSVAGQISVAIENARLRELKERAIVEERERIARELHDGLAQLLTYINTKVIAARLRLRRNQFDGADEYLQQLEEATQTLFIDVREAVLNLRMSGEIGGGFPTLIADYTANFTKLSGLPVEIDITPQAQDLPIPLGAQLQLLRIIQGALSNVRKHASATHARIDLRLQNGLMELVIADDGCGFDPEQAAEDGRLHFGLLTMKERAEDIGAELAVHSAPGSGTRVIVHLKIEETTP